MGRYTRNVAIGLAILALNQEVYPSITVQPPEEGNFSLPGSQQPGPLYSFGQNIISKNQIILFANASYQRTVGGSIPQQLNNLLYGISDSNSLLIASPYFFQQSQNKHESSGFGDTTIQFEQSVYSSTTASNTQSATILFGLNTPTGSANKNPSTGNGAYSYFLGATYNETYVYWMWFSSFGMTQKTAYQDITHKDPIMTKPGNDFFYQAGFGKNIGSTPGSSELEFLVEFGGTYSTKTTTGDTVNSLSGGNIIYATPSLWYSTPHWFLQLGCSLPLSQHRNDVQSNSKYILSSSVGYTIS